MTEASEELIRALADDSDDTAARALYRAHASELFGFAVSRLGDRGLAEELVQDVFTKVWQHAGSFDGRRGSFRTWMYGIARNAVVDLERRRASRFRGAAGEPPEIQRAEEPIERAMLRWHVREALVRLSSEHREVIRLAYLQGFSLREVAARTGVPLGTVKSRASYALRNLRLALEEMGGL